MKSEYYEIFVATVGKTPQIVTEALYYYYTTDPPRFFDEIILLTTRDCEAAIKTALLENGKLSLLEQSIGLPRGSIPLTQDSIHVFRDSTGEGIPDIRTSRDTLFEFSDIYHVISQWTRKQDTRLTVTIAGGRKTMSVAGGLAMQVLGRPQDELIHVLVPEAYDSRVDWYFPTDTGDPNQKIDIMKIPFPRLRAFVPESLLVDTNESDPEKMIRQIQDQLDENKPLTKVVIRKQGLIIQDEFYALPPKLMAMWRWFARRKTEHCTRPDAPSCQNCQDCWVPFDDDFVSKYKLEIMGQDYRELIGPGSLKEENLEKLNQKRYDFVKDDISQVKSRLNGIMMRKWSLPLSYFDAIKISTERKEEERYLGLKADKRILHFTE